MARFKDILIRAKRWAALETTDEYAERTLTEAAKSLGVTGDIRLEEVMLELDAGDKDVDSVIAYVKRGDIGFVQRARPGDFGGDSDIVRVLKITDGAGRSRLLALLDPVELFQDPVGLAVSDPL